MHVYIHTKKGGVWKNRKIRFMVTRASKATENIWSCTVHHGKQARKVIQFKAALLCTVYITSKNTFSRTFGKKSTLFP